MARRQEVSERRKLMVAEDQRRRFDAARFCGLRARDELARDEAAEAFELVFADSGEEVVEHGTIPCFWMKWWMQTVRM